MKNFITLKTEDPARKGGDEGFSHSASNGTGLRPKGGETGEDTSAVLVPPKLRRSVVGRPRGFFFLSSIIVATIVFVYGIPAMAHESDLAQISAAAAEDFGVAEPSLLPTSPFYFVKEWGRGIRLFLTFNPVAKAELQLKFADEKAVETGKVVEKTPEKVESLNQALENYQETVAGLASRLADLKETSQNPNIDKLLIKLADRAVKHEQLFEELKEQLTEDDAKAELDKSKNDIAEELLKAADKLEGADKLVRRLKKAADAAEVKDELENVLKIVFFDDIEKTAKPEVKEELRKAREDFLDDAKDILEEQLKGTTTGAIADKLKALFSDAPELVEIIAEIKLRTTGEYSNKLEQIKDSLEKTPIAAEKRVEKAREQIYDAEEKVAELEKKISEKSDKATSSVKQDLTKAREKLATAKKAFVDRDYGEAHGQAVAAEAAARNGLRLIEETEVDTEDLKDDIAELETKIQRYDEALKARGWTEENASEEYRLLGEAKKHIGFARDALAKNDFAGTKLHIGHVKDWLRNLAHLMSKATDVKAIKALAPAVQSTEEKEESSDKIVPRVICAQEWNPVCGSNGKTYSNECMAEAVGVAVKYKGECQTAATTDCGSKPSLPAPTAGCKYDGPVCYDGKWKYTLVCPESSEMTPTTASPTSTKDTNGTASTNSTVIPIDSTGTAVITSQSFKIEADDSGFYPSGTITVAKGAKVSITFIVKSSNVYFGGLDFRGSKFKTGTIKPGGTATVEFTVDESFEFNSYWPLTNTLKSTGKVVVQ